MLNITFEKKTNLIIVYLLDRQEKLYILFRSNRYNYIRTVIFFLNVNIKYFGLLLYLELSVGINIIPI